jgi:hypothetical protein
MLIRRCSVDMRTYWAASMGGHGGGVLSGAAAPAHSRDHRASTAVRRPAPMAGPAPRAQEEPQQHPRVGLPELSFGHSGIVFVPRRLCLAGRYLTTVDCAGRDVIHSLVEARASLEAEGTSRSAFRFGPGQARVAHDRQHERNQRNAGGYRNQCLREARCQLHDCLQLRGFHGELHASGEMALGLSRL